MPNVASAGIQSGDPASPATEKTDAAQPAPRFWRTISATLRLIAFIIFAILATEVISTQSVAEPFVWLWHQPLALLLTTIIALSCLGLLVGIIGRLRIAAVCLVLILFLLATISSIKAKTLGMPLFPWDIWLTRQAAKIPAVFEQEFKIHFMQHVLPLVLLASAVAMTRLMHKWRPGPVIRITLILLSPAVLLGFVFYKSNPLVSIVSCIEWNQPENYQKNGLCLAFLTNVRACLVVAPTDYSADRLAAFAKTIPPQSSLHNAGPGTQGDMRPDLIVVMSEALWDPTWLTGTNIVPDPLLNMRRLSPNGVLQSVLSPTFGGGTCNVEFELLTGMSMGLLPEGSIPYQQYISSHVPSMVSTLKARGYKAVALHPYLKWYWNREDVYRHLGFDAFIGENDFSHNARAGTLINDQSVMEEIDSSLSGDQPVFLFAITMQNHWPYFSGKSVESSLQISNSIANDSTKYMFENYCRGVQASDRSLEWLVEKLKGRKRPTVLAFFGDHLPAMGDNYGAYRESGFIAKSTEALTADESFKMSRVPILLWHSIRGGIRVPEVSISFLGPLILEQLNGGLPPYYRFLEQLSGTMPALHLRYSLDADRKLRPGSPPNSDFFKDYKLLQYDLLFGQSYGAAMFND